jgi:hypothetical protein
MVIFESRGDASVSFTTKRVPVSPGFQLRPHTVVSTFIILGISCALLSVNFNLVAIILLNCKGNIVAM